MTTTEPQAELLHSEFLDFDGPTSWNEAQQRLANARETYWLALTGEHATPHVRPILAVWADDALHFVSGSSTVKTGFLDGQPKITITVAADDIDLVVEGTVARVTEEEALRQVADAYAGKYEWPVTVRDGAFHATEGAPTAGPPPFQVYRVVPSAVYGFDAETYPPTRWRF